MSISSTTEQGNSNSNRPSISADGRFVVFSSLASNLIADDTNRVRDVFVHDLTMHRTWRVSVSSMGRQATGHSIDPSVSADGWFVAYESAARNLVEGDTNGEHDVFVRGPLR